MSKYVDRYCCVDAVQWDPSIDIDAYPEWFDLSLRVHPSEYGSITIAGTNEESSYLIVRTPYGLKRCHPGDYVVYKGKDWLQVYTKEEFKEMYIEYDEAIKPIVEFLKSKRFDEKSHLGLGDIRLTIGDQEDLLKLLFKQQH